MSRASPPARQFRSADLRPRASGGGVEPGVIEEVETDEETRLAPPWNVIVHDDPVTLMVYVVMVLRRTFGYGPEKAEELMMEVHKTGRSIVWTGPRERAEFYVARLHGALLLATLERAET